jgi:ABC-type transport system involved in cytochrome c biogenesis ATPase subunit
MVIGALIGWFFATPFKAQIHARLNHFPILNVWGTMGAGKTSLLRLFWRLLGVDSELLACTDRGMFGIRVKTGHKYTAEIYV